MASATTVTIPPTLAFLVSNFHSLVTIKLDGSNFLLWKTQVENVLNANGYLGYIDGTVVCPSAQIRNSSEELITNPAYTLWMLIDSQLLACLTASLSQTTLPYVLGLHRSFEVWASLNSRYNSMTTTHIHDLRSKLYSLTKTSTMESYIDTIKTYAQKLAAAGNPLSDEDLVFHTLHGLSPAFNGFKTGIRTSGNTKLTFDALVTMLSGEDLQMTQDPSMNVENNTVLVATQSNPNSNVSNVIPSPTASVSLPQPPYNPSSQILPQPQYNPSSQIIQPQLFSPSPSYLTSQQFLPPQLNHFNRGKGGRGPRFPRDPCGICGKSNHITQFCYYRGQFPSFAQPFSSNSWIQNASTFAQNQWPQYTQWTQPNPMPPANQWRGSPSSSMPSTSYQFNGMQSQGMFVPAFAQVQPSGFRSMAPQTGTSSGPFGNSLQSGFPSVSPGMFGNSIQSGFPSIAQANVAGYAMSASDATPAGYSVPMMSSGCQTFGVQSGGIQGHPWYFDSGATSHITNNLQNITHPQSTYMAGGVQVGNGSQLPITHSGSGQEVSSDSLQGALQRGSLSSTELL